MESAFVSNIDHTNPSDLQRSLHTHDLDSGEDKDLVVVRPVHVLLGQENGTYLY